MKKVRRPNAVGGVGAFLRDVRHSRGLSLRDVERATEGGVSNAYLSQLESGGIASPSAIMLNRLAVAYALDYQTLIARGGMAAPDAEPLAEGEPSVSGAIRNEPRDIFGSLSQDEERQLLQYLAFLRR